MAKQTSKDDETLTGPTAKVLREAGYDVSDKIGDDERAFAYQADTVITDPNSPDAVQTVQVPVVPVDNTLTPNQFAAGQSKDADKGAASQAQ